MAKQIEAGKFLVIECTAGELMDAVGSDICICDWCGRAYLPSDRGCYISVLNHWYCKECYEEWIARAEWYLEDADIERRNFNFYAPRLGVNVRSNGLPLRNSEEMLRRRELIKWRLICLRLLPISLNFTGEMKYKSNQ